MKWSEGYYEKAAESVDTFCTSYAGPYTKQLEIKARELAGKQDDFCLICLQEKPVDQLYPQTGPSEIHYCPRRFCSSCYKIDPHWKKKTSRTELPIYRKYPGWISQSCPLCWRRSWDLWSPLLGVDHPGWKEKSMDQKKTVQFCRWRLWVYNLEGKFSWRKKLISFEDKMTLESDRELIRLIDNVVPVKWLKQQKFTPIPPEGRTSGMLTSANIFDPLLGLDLLASWLIGLYQEVFEDDVADKNTMLQSYVDGVNPIRDPDTITVASTAAVDPPTFDSVANLVSQADTDIDEIPEMVVPWFQGDSVPASHDSPLDFFEDDSIFGDPLVSMICDGSRSDSTKCRSKSPSADDQTAGPQTSLALVKPPRGRLKNRRPLVENNPDNLPDKGFFPAARRLRLSGKRKLADLELESNGATHSTDSISEAPVATPRSLSPAIVTKRVARPSRLILHVPSFDINSPRSNSHTTHKLPVSKAVIDTTRQQGLSGHSFNNTPSLNSSKSCATPPDCFDDEDSCDHPVSTVKKSNDQENQNTALEHQLIQQMKTLIQAYTKTRNDVETEMKQQNETLRSNNAKLRARSKEHNARLDNLTERHTKVKEDLTSANNKLASQYTELVDALSDRNAQASRAIQLQKEIDRLQKDNTELDDLIKSTQQTIDVCMKESANLQTQNLRLKTALENSQQQTENLHKSNLTVEQDYEAIIIRLETESRQRTKDEEALRTQLSRAEARVTQLITKNEQLEAVNEELSRLAKQNSDQFVTSLMDKCSAYFTNWSKTEETLTKTEENLTKVQAEFDLLRLYAANAFVELVISRNKEWSSECEPASASGEHLSIEQIDYLFRYPEFSQKMHDLGVVGINLP